MEVIRLDSGVNWMAERLSGSSTQEVPVNYISCTIHRRWWLGETTSRTSPIMGVEMGSSESSHCAHSSISSETKCWGWNGNGEAEPPTNNPTQIDAGPQHYCAIDDEE